MTRTIKFLLGFSLVLTLLLGVTLAALAWWVSGDGLRVQIQEAASEQLGVPVLMEKISLDVWPLPSVTLQGLVIQTQPRLSAQRVELRPAWGSLMRAPRQLELISLHLQGVQLPQRGLDQMQIALSKRQHFVQIPQWDTAQKDLKTEVAALTPALLGLLAIPQRITLDKLTWQSVAGEDLSVSGDIAVNVARDMAQLSLELAGGTLRGPVRLSGMEKSGALLLRGELVTSSLDLSALPGLRALMSGRLQATTTLESQATQLSGLGAFLQTRTQFSVSSAVIKGIDLAKAVTTLGLSRGGETALSQLSGNLSTRSTGAAMQITLSDLQAASSILKASGAVNVGAAARAGGPRPLNGKINVDLNAPDGGTGAGKALGALVGIPLEISGTTASPTVAPTRGAMIGGAIGSVMAPVIGTGAGAKMGDKVGEKLSALKERLFGK
jgi:hypothetical protein